MKSFIAQKNGKLSKLCLYNIEDLSFSTFMKALRKKDVKVNGKRTSQDIAVSVGDKVEVYYVENSQEKYEQIFLDKNVLVVYKKSGYTSENLFESIKSTYPNACFIHRLDRNTDGIMIFALNETAEEELLSGFKNRTFDKKYTALRRALIEKQYEKLNPAQRSSRRSVRFMLCGVRSRFRSLARRSFMRVNRHGGCGCPLPPQYRTP